MTEIEQKALALVNEVLAENGMNNTPHTRLPTAVSNLVLLRAIEQHEQFKREVSDAVEAVFAGYHDAPIPWVVMRSKLEPFIIAKPDPLVEAIDEIWEYAKGCEHVPVMRADQLRAALAKRGLEVREIEG